MKEMETCVNNVAENGGWCIKRDMEPEEKMCSECWLYKPDTVKEMREILKQDENNK